MSKKKQIISSLLEGFDSVVEAEPTTTTDIEIYADDIAFNEAMEPMFLVTKGNLKRLVANGHVVLSNGTDEFQSLDEALLSDGGSLLTEAYQENKMTDFDYDVSEEDAKFLSDNADDLEMGDDGHWHYTDKAGKKRKILSTQKFKVSKGNVKVGGDTVIVNMSSGTDCMSALLGMCPFAKTEGKASECYAQQGEALRPDALKAKRFQHVQWRKLDGEKLGLGILLTIASMSTASKIKFVRMNESGEFADAASEAVLSKLTPEARAKYTKSASSDIEKMNGILGVVSKVKENGIRSVYESVMDAELADKLIKTSTMSNILKKAEAVSQNLGFYTYSHRHDLEGKLLGLAKTYPNFCINGSGKMMSNNFAAMPWVVFNKIFGNSDKNAMPKKISEILKDADILDGTGYNEKTKEMLEQIKAMMVEAMGENANNIVAPCRNNCALPCDYCKVPRKRLIVIPLHGNGSDTTSNLRKMNTVISSIAKEISHVVLKELDGMSVAEYVKKADTSKKDVKKEMLDKINPIMASIIKERLGGKHDDGVDLFRDVFNLLVFGKDRGEVLIDAIRSTQGEAQLAHVLMETANVISAFSGIDDALNNRGMSETEAGKIIAQTNEFLHPHMEHFNIGRMDADLNAKKEEFTNTISALGAGHLDAKTAKGILGRLAKTSEEMAKHIAKKLRGKEGEALSPTERKKLENARDAFSAEAKVLSTKSGNIEVLGDVRRMSLEKTQSLLQKDWMDIEAELEKEGIKKTDLPLVNRMYDIIQNALATENAGTANLYYRIIDNLKTQLLKGVAATREGDEEFKPKFIKPSKEKLLSKDVKEASVKSKEAEGKKEVVKESLISKTDRLLD